MLSQRATVAQGTPTYACVVSKGMAWTHPRFIKPCDMESLHGMPYLMTHASLCLALTDPVPHQSAPWSTLRFFLKLYDIMGLIPYRRLRSRLPAPRAA